MVKNRINGKAKTKKLSTKFELINFNDASKKIMNKKPKIKILNL